MTKEKTAPNGSKNLTVTIIICTTLVLLAAIGSWVYIQNRQLQQNKQLKEYEQQQINQRQENDQNSKLNCQFRGYKNC